MHPDEDEHMLKVRANGLGCEGMSSRLLEHNGHDVVPNVAFPQQLVIEESTEFIRPHTGVSNKKKWQVESNKRALLRQTGKKIKTVI